METRLIIAYSLIALMTALALFAVVLIQRERAKVRRRDAGHGDHMA